MVLWVIRQIFTKRKVYKQVITRITMKKQGKTNINNKRLYNTLKDCGATRYGLVSKKKRLIAICLIGSSFIIPDLGIGLLCGMCLLGLNIRLIAKDKIKYIKQGICLKMRCLL